MANSYPPPPAAGDHRWLEGASQSLRAMVGYPLVRAVHTGDVRFSMITVNPLSYLPSFAMVKADQIGFNKNKQHKRLFRRGDSTYLMYLVDGLLEIS